MLIQLTHNFRTSSPLNFITLKRAIKRWKWTKKKNSTFLNIYFYNAIIQKSCRVKQSILLCEINRKCIPTTIELMSLVLTGFYMCKKNFRCSIVIECFRVFRIIYLIVYVSSSNVFTIFEHHFGKSSYQRCLVSHLDKRITYFTFLKIHL